jgi:hypothetical protein
LIFITAAAAAVLRMKNIKNEKYYFFTIIIYNLFLIHTIIGNDVPKNEPTAIHN